MKQNKQVIEDVQSIISDIKMQTKGLNIFIFVLKSLNSLPNTETEKVPHAVFIPIGFLHKNKVPLWDLKTLTG